MEVNKILQGDCLEVLKTLPENSVDSIVTDPPYELGFMNRAWDKTGIANNKDMWAECLRVLKPGGHLLAFSGTRTYHRMASAIEDAGFEVRDMIEWVYGSGFPKSLDISKAIEKMNGVEPLEKIPNKGERFYGQEGSDYHLTPNRLVMPETQTEDGKKWEGWGTALKPAHEPICMARKPLAEKTVAENCLKYGTGGINIDESRVDKPEGDESGWSKTGSKAGENRAMSGANYERDAKPDSAKRFPANLIHDNSEEVRECFPDAKGWSSQNNSPTNVYGGNSLLASKTKLPEHREGYNDSGNASRFFKSIIYQAKASKSERNKGCEGMPEKRPDERTETGMGTFEEKGVAKQSNFHPTVKPIALMEYLIKMVTRPGGIVLDPFAGSGSTLVAAKQNGYQYIGIELTPEYIPIIEARLKSPISQKLF